MCINVPTPLRKDRELAAHLTLASTNRPITFENTGSGKMGRCVLSFLGIGIILAIFHVVGSIPSVNDWLLSLRKMCLVASGAFFTME